MHKYTATVYLRGRGCAGTLTIPADNTVDATTIARLMLTRLGIQYPLFTVKQVGDDARVGYDERLAELT